MTPDRIRALEAVAEAAREEARCLAHLRDELAGRVEGEAASKFFGVMDRALRRLNAAPAAVRASAEDGA